MLTAGLILGLLGLGLYVYRETLSGISTDDATIEADVVTVMAKVPAYVQRLTVDDNSAVTRGQLMIELDPRDYVLAVDAARSAVDAATSKFAEAQAQITATDADAEQAIADRAAARAQDRLAASIFARRTRLGDLSISAEGRDSARADADSAHANLGSAEMKIAGAEARKALAHTQLRTAEVAVDQAKVVLAQAELNLSYTKISAPLDGSIANRAVVAGNYVEPGQLMLSVVPRDVYVIANFKETQLHGIARGQAATIAVDALDGARLHAHVDSIQRGSGSRFALLPPENATDNFVKVVQRIPVKLKFDEPPERLQALAPGMSVIVRMSEPGSGPGFAP
jgi:membrane fusion protein (multidrug efflux system)